MTFAPEFGMRLLVSLLLAGCGLATPHYTYLVSGDDPGPWPAILGSVGLTSGTAVPPRLFVVRSVQPGSAAAWLQRIEGGATVILEGPSELSLALGITPTAQKIEIRSIVDEHAPRVPL